MLYFYEKYNMQDNWVSAIGTQTTGNVSVGQGFLGYADVSINKLTGDVTPVGEQIQYTYNGNFLALYTNIGLRSYRQIVAWSDGRLVTTNYGVTNRPIKGNYIETVTAEEGTYPSDDIQGDYWYVKTHLAEKPTLTSPVGGETWEDEHDITWQVPRNGLSFQIQLSTDNGVNWHTIKDTAIDATSYTHDFSNETETSTARIRIRAYDNKTYGPWEESSGVFTIMDNKPPTEPTNLQPKGITVDKTIVQRLSWTFNDPNVNDSQSKFDIQWRKQGLTTWNNVTQNTSRTYYDANTELFPEGQIEWRVRTYDLAGLQSPYSNIAVFTSAEPTDAPVITYPANSVPIPRPTVEWNSNDQVAYQLIIEDSLNAEIWNTGEVNSSNKARTVGIDLDNGGQYTIKLRVKDSGDIWSDYASVDITVSYTPPAQPIINAEDVEAGIKLIIDNPTPTGTQPNVLHNDLYKRINNKWVRIAKEIAKNGTYTDYAVASEERAEYRVRAISADNDTFRESDVEQVTAPKILGVWLHDVSDTSTLYNYRADGGGRNEEKEVEHAFFKFAGRKKPVVQFGNMDDFAVSANVSLLKDDEGKQRLDKFVRNRNTILYRDSRGRKVYGVIPTINFDEIRSIGYSVPINVIEIDYDEEV